MQTAFNNNNNNDKMLIMQEFQTLQQYDDMLRCSNNLPAKLDILICSRINTSSFGIQANLFAVFSTRYNQLLSLSACNKLGGVKECISN